MSPRNLILFTLALVVGLAAAWYRFGDSAHALGLLSARGGKVRHPVALDQGHARYAVVITATVLPPWRGDATVAVEGETSLDWDIRPAGPVVDLGLHRGPRWEGSTLRGLRPRDRLALWLTLRRPADEIPASPTRPLRLTFRDASNGQALLEVPILFVARESAHDR